MSYTINAGVITGNITKDADIRTTPTGKTVAKFSIASNRSVKSQSGEWEQVASFFNVDAFVPDRFAPLLLKGRKVAVEYELRQDRWQDKNTGDNKSRVYLFAKNVLLIDGKKEQQQQSFDSYDQSGYQQPPQIGEPMRDEEVPF